MSTFVDNFIRPLAEATPSFLKDTGHVLTVIELLITFYYGSVKLMMWLSYGVVRLMNFRSSSCIWVTALNTWHLQWTLTQLVLAFRDVWIIHENNILYTDLFIKPTACNCPKQIPVTLYHRRTVYLLARFAEWNEFAAERLIISGVRKWWESKFHARGYKVSQINTAVNKINNIPRADLLCSKPKKKEPTIIFSTCYTKCSKLKVLLTDIGIYLNQTWILVINFEPHLR